MTTWRVLARLLAEVPRRWVASLVALTVLCSLTEGIGLLLLVPLLGSLGERTGAANPVVAHLLASFRHLGLATSLPTLLLAFVALVGCRSAILHGRDQMTAALQHRVVDRLRQQCFDALLAAEWRWLVAGRRADHANLLLTDVARVGVGLHHGLAWIAVVATAAAYIAVGLLLSWWMTLVVLVTGGAVMLALATHRRAALRLGQQLGAANRAMQRHVQDSLAGLKLAKIQGVERHHRNAFAQAVGQLRADQLRFQSGSSMSRAWFQVGGAALLAIYLYAGLRWWSLPQAELLVLVMLFARLVPLFLTAHQSSHHWLHALPAVHEIDALLAEAGAAAETPAPPDAAPPSLQVALVLDAVSIGYAGRDRPALDRVSLRLAARTTTAVLGPSGAGKSTLADVVVGLLAPDQGQVLVDGMPLEGALRRTWRAGVAYVPQEVFLFHGSIRDNLLWGVPAATEDELRQALRLAAADFVQRLPEGLDTRVGDGGVQLSGGERQRIALARALIRRPVLLVLDEATSALDLDNEARIGEVLQQLRGSVTVVVIGHRLATLEHADQVVVLECGAVAAQGTWAEIRARKVPYGGARNVDTEPA